MAWPLDRLFSYLTGSPVRAADLNSIQDQIIADGHAERVFNVNPIAETLDSTWKPPSSTVMTLIATDGSEFAIVPIPGLREGDRIKAWSVTGQKADNSASLSAQFYYIDFSANPIVEGSRSAVTQTSSGVFTIGETGVDFLVGAGDQFAIKLVAKSTNDIISSIQITIDHP